ncbi:MAG: TolC family protein [Candidatus Cloacimonetes bacterium]|nr:TolC family protein [Candidatus Cloacimonadota bacterium]MCF7813995.1 TolC family protein [Candidatus Cloacimonadota bacterium]MCF7868623.1 TolC family protein [Candidatus Cloacimonadota bacterium]MCF7882852.1 TolC family protein [Candidatus Cloacimonadota bacterium]
MRRKLILLIMLMPLILLQAISLEDSIEIARENNKDLLAQKSGVESANWAKKNAFTNFLPKISFNSTAVRIDDETYDEMNEPITIPGLGSFSIYSVYKTTYTNDITVQQPIFNGGKVILGYQMAKLTQKQAELALLNKEKDTDLAVATSYFGLLKLNDLKTLSQKSLNSTLSHLETVLKKYDVGTAKKSDVLQWQVKMKNDETSITEIVNSISELTGFWNNLLGMDGDLPNPIEVEKFDSEIDRFAGMNDTEIEQEIADFLQKVKTSSPTIATMSIARKMMQKNYCMAKGSFLPSLNLQYSYQFESDDKFDFDGDDNWNLAAVFSVPIFHSGTNYTNMKKAKYELKKTEYEMDWAQENYLVSAENVLRKLVTKAKLVQNNKIALDYAKENHQIINDLFNQGLVTNSEVLDAEAMLFGSEMNLVAAYYDFILAKYEIKKYTNEGSK